MQTTGFEPTQVPLLLQASVRVQALASEHVVPLGRLTQASVEVAGTQLWQPFEGFTAPSSKQAPSIKQRSSLRGGVPHSPVAGLHVPALWHESGAEQVTGVEPTQAPLPLQASVCVQALASEHVVPLERLVHAAVDVAGAQLWHWFDGLSAFSAMQASPMKQYPDLRVAVPHCPLPVLHVPALWHVSGAEQVTGFDPTQVPAPLQVSVCVHWFPSLQAVPLALLLHAVVDVAGVQT